MFMTGVAVQLPPDPNVDLDPDLWWNAAHHNEELQACGVHSARREKSLPESHFLKVSAESITKIGQKKWLLK